MESLIPVILISGFLGAGKTTLLNAIIQQHPEVPLFIIENEFGDINIDGALLNKGLRDTVELSGGCICCSLDTGFREALLEIAQKIPSNGYLLVETTGLADPAQIKKALLTDGMLQSRFVLQSTITIADAGAIEKWLHLDSEVRTLAARQLSAADLIVLSRADLISEKQNLDLHRLLHNWQPLATIENAFLGKTEIDILHWTPPPISTANFRLHLAANLPDTMPIMEAHSFQYTQPFQLMALIHRMNVMLKIQGKDIYRIKGWIYAFEESHKFFIQSAGDAFLISKGPEWEQHEEKNSALVWIGTQLMPSVLDKNLRACLAKLA